MREWDVGMVAVLVYGRGVTEVDRANGPMSRQNGVMRTREENGGWNDRIFPRSEGYGTAMVVLALMAPSLVERSEP